MSIAIVGGALANKCRNGGEAWVRLSWIRGLQKLGFTTYFVEQIERDQCRDAAGEVTDFEHCENLAYFKQVTHTFGLDGFASLVCADGRAAYGLSATELADVMASADILINISGNLSLDKWPLSPRFTVFVDIDPGFTQFWHAAGEAGARLSGHDFYYTIGENIGGCDCLIPTGGIAWRRTRQPVVLEDWPISPTDGIRKFTTVASWRGAFGRVEYGGKTFGLKVHEFRKFMELPGLTGEVFEIALDIHPADCGDLNRLHDCGWRTVDPQSVASDPESFRRYIQNSGAEFSVAQGIYVETRSGWFSDRTVRYLASGKPVLVQDTGFGHQLPVGVGLLAFQTLDEAVTGIKAIARDYEQHCAAARAVTREHFDSGKVLGRLLEEVGVKL